jgi:hypothetical protein
MGKRKNEYGEESADSPDYTSDPLAMAPEGGNAPPAEVAPTSLTGIAPTPGASAADIEAASEQSGGEEPPRAAPKGGEGTNEPARQVEHPELEPPVPPTEYRVAPSAPGELEREEFEGTRPTFDEVKQAGIVLAQTTDKKSAGVYVGGVFVTSTPVEVDVESVLARGASHLRALITDLRVQLKV